MSTGLDKTLKHYPDLRELVKAWPDLPEDTRTAIKALVKNTRSGETIDGANMSELKAKQTAFIEDRTHMMLASSITRIGRLSSMYITTGSKIVIANAELPTQRAQC